MENIYLSILIIFSACSNQQGQNKNTDTMEQHKFTNSLINETSPYLLQHAHNPVNWYPWGDEALNKAKQENKLILISIGYSACHWCHVMEHKSFENEAIAELMNQNFVCIKVDREERPDLDQVYMSAVQMISGSGGWPLNCFALPDGRPIYGGTYFPPEQWTQVLQGLAKTYKEDPERVLKAADEIEAGLQNHELIAQKSNKKTFSVLQTDQMLESWKPYFDLIWGGNKRTPKFPMPVSYDFLLSYSELSNDLESLDHLNLTLNKIANGGIYDHIGGGFARYSVDAEWKAPHFEKMLYDNGQLVSLYSKAYKKTKNKQYKRVIKKTLEFIQREMTTKEGAFYSSYDADSEGVEGKFYVWDKEEIEATLGNNADWFCEYYNVTNHGNWEDGNILWVTNHKKVLAKYNFTDEPFFVQLEKAQLKLLKVRSKRIYPGLDDKVLTSWNALMSIGYLNAHEAFGNKEYLESALKNAMFIKNTMLQKDGNLHRNFKNGRTTINAFLDDYALTIQLFTKLYQNTFNEQWLTEAKLLTDYVLNHFFDTTSGMFYYTSDLDPALVTRKMELSDNVIPASNSIMANNLFNLGVITSNDDWKTLAEQMLSNVIGEVEKSASYYGNWGILLNKLAYPFYEIVFVGENADKFRINLQEEYLPNTILAGTTNKENSDLPLLLNRWVDGETYIYICRNSSCKLPVKTTKEALNLLK
ncbi:MAG: thioredoxin domain-containing protein [Salinivirgaceae bacterium]|jgi:uncharacterized protein YyaL (SSP411 family)|nr:thioredoxin domain-containing protein [Salinivirgaceae bacterium]